MKKILWILAIVAMSIPASAFPVVSETFLKALRLVESQDGKYVNGANGERGPYQISEAYLRDTGLPYTLAEMEDEAKARKVVLTYLRKYAPADCTYEQLARIHNGGPKGHLKPSTARYWQRVKKFMEDIM